MLGPLQSDPATGQTEAVGAYTASPQAASPPAIEWQFYPRSKRATSLAVMVAEAFKGEIEAMSSSVHEHSSNRVLEILRPRLIALGFQVEVGKRKDQTIDVPVLFGRNGRVEKHFKADAYHAELGFVLEVEAGRGVVNNQFLKDLFQACMMSEVRYLAIAIRKTYQGNKDFETVCTFFDTLYASDRLSLPLDGLLVIGY